MKKNLNPFTSSCSGSSHQALTYKWKTIFLVLLMLTGLRSFAQFEATKWYFGYYAGLDFMTTPPTPILTGSMNTTEGCASIADAAGNTLFYTDGITVYNKYDLVMPNGTGLLGDGSSTQSGIIVKQPGNTNIYYIFTQDDVGGPDGFCYSIVDMNLSGGTGSVTTKNFQLHTPSCEKITAVKHCNGVDVWIVSHDYGSNAFRTYLLTASGINTSSPVMSSVGTTINNMYTTLGQMKVAPNGRKLGLAIYDVGNLQPYEIYDFDPATGIVSNQLILLNSSDNYGCEFSPDGTKFYGASFGTYNIFQWDLCAGTSTAIASSIYSISTGNTSPCELQMAKDGKIYIAMLNGNLSCINAPNLSGAACGYSANAVTFTSPHAAALGLPNFVNSYFKPASQPFTYSATCQDVNFFAPAPQGTVASGCSFATNSVVSMVWNFGDPASAGTNTSNLSNPSHTFSAGGTYTVKLALNYACSTDTIILPITVSGLSFTLTGHSTVCPKEKHIYSGTGATSYSWSTGATTPTIALTTSVTTMYTVTAYGSGPNPCKIVKTFVVTVAKCTGIDEEEEFNPVKIYPNPNKGNLTIETEKEISVVISNSLGQIIKEKSFEKGSYTLDISAYHDGVYFVKYSTGSGSRIVRLIKTE